MERVEDTDIEYDDGIAFLNDDVYTGEVVELDSDGNVIGLITYKRGHEHGPWLEWYSSGARKVEGQVDIGKGAVGTWRHWHENGRLAQERRFDDRGRALSNRTWDAEGNLVEDRQYSNPM
ncbi:toxin-antitoxin system YwqK family antitoxin [Streptomonospora wellingtoniae]|uniref:Toxin-antitoxin system YwqK family antitoxin n=1 Tax=Streptomonospora wellingtoniae TaxID=3075544 RepID=A0ABU2L035_9ACTN|nr:hypothetical protein [Streptomonospora sp. DSM 45055]MDT0304781.1 hypothetical protein [Streptomonospora sp. DSM 45055]